MSSERFDAVVVGPGRAGEVAVSRLAKHGLRTALVERELIGAECASWACIPSKTPLRPPEARFEAKRAAGTAEPEQRWAEVAAHRDSMIHNPDDSGQADGDRNKGEARLAGPGRVEVGGETLAAERVVLATGGDANVPSIPGLEGAGYWTKLDTTPRSFPEPDQLRDNTTSAVEVRGQVKPHPGADGVRTHRFVERTS